MVQLQGKGPTMRIGTGMRGKGLQKILRDASFDSRESSHPITLVTVCKVGADRGSSQIRPMFCYRNRWGPTVLYDFYLA